VRSRRLPFRLTGALWASSGLCFVGAAVTGQDARPLVRAATAGVVTAGVLLVVALALPGQLGLGDVALAGAVTFNLGWLSWRAAVIGLLAALLVQGVIAIALRLRRRERAMSPMGPALLAGWILAVAATAQLS